MKISENLAYMFGQNFKNFTQNVRILSGIGLQWQNLFGLANRPKKSPNLSGREHQASKMGYFFPLLIHFVSTHSWRGELSGASMLIGIWVVIRGIRVEDSEAIQHVIHKTIQGVDSTGWNVGKENQVKRLQRHFAHLNRDSNWCVLVVKYKNK